MSEFKTVSVSISFDVCISNASDLKVPQAEIALEECIQTISPAIGNLVRRNISISSVEFTAKFEEVCRKYKASPTEIKAALIRSQTNGC